MTTKQDQRDLVNELADKMAEFIKPSVDNAWLRVEVDLEDFPFVFEIGFDGYTLTYKLRHSEGWVKTSEKELMLFIYEQIDELVAYHSSCTADGTYNDVLSVEVSRIKKTKEKENINRIMFKLCSIDDHGVASLSTEVQQVVNDVLLPMCKLYLC